MGQFYFNQHGIHSDVVYPIGSDKKINVGVERKEEKPLTVVFFGNIWKPLSQLNKLATILNKRGIRLVLFCNRNVEFFGETGKLENVTINALISNEDLMKWCKIHADIFYLPMYFDKDEIDMVKTSFPSKIVDYLSLIHI